MNKRDKLFKIAEMVGKAPVEVKDLAVGTYDAYAFIDIIYYVFGQSVVHIKKILNKLDKI